MCPPGEHLQLRLWDLLRQVLGEAQRGHPVAFPTQDQGWCLDPSQPSDHIKFIAGAESPYTTLGRASDIRFAANSFSRSGALASNDQSTNS